MGKNAAGGTAMVINPDIKASFESEALPVAKRKNLGIIAMKVFAADGLAGQATPERLLYYALSLPVSTASVGMPTLDFVAQNTAMARSFKPLSAAEMMSMVCAEALSNNSLHGCKLISMALEVVIESEFVLAVGRTTYTTRI